MSKSDVFRTTAGRRAVAAAYSALLDDQLPDADRRVVHTGLGPTFVLSAGTSAAPPVLLLHGSGATALSWARELGVLGDTYRVHAVDVVGESGRSAPTRPPLDGDSYACWLTEVTAALDSCPAVVVGTSFGGWLALDYAIRAPHRVAALVLVAPSGLARPALLPLLIAAMLSPLGDRGRRAALRYLLSLPRAPTVDLLDQRLGALAVLTFQHFRPRTDPMPVFTDDQLAGLSLPVKIMLGGQDRMLDATGSAHRAQRLLGNVSIDLLPQTGHLIPDRTERIAAALQDLTNPT